MFNAHAVQAFVMAGGCGSRLQPLTGSRCKPALPFGGNFRVVDFVLGNLLNSGVVQVELLVQYQPQALVGHVRAAWCARFEAAGGRLNIAAPLLPRVGFRGTADAVHQHLDRAGARRAKLAVVFGADHVYRMDVRRMIDFHLANGADATIATLPVPLESAGDFGIVGVDDGGRARRFDEKPRHPLPMPDRPGTALASMGNYVFDLEVLRKALARCDELGWHDFGHHVLPRMIGERRVFAYDFTAHRVPGVQSHEEPHYWRDVGTLDAYFAAHLDTLGGKPRFNLDNPHWPVAAPAEGAPPRVVRSAAQRSCIAADAEVDGATLDQVVVGRGARIARGAQLERCIVLDGASVGPDARLRDTIVDGDNAVPAGSVIGHARDDDSLRFPISDGGIVVVPRGHFGASRGALLRDDVGRAAVTG